MHRQIHLKSFKVYEAQLYLHRRLENRVGGYLEYMGLVSVILEMSNMRERDRSCFLVSKCVSLQIICEGRKIKKCLGNSVSDAYAKE